MNFVGQAVSYLLTADNWTGPVGLAARILEHLEYTAIAVGASAEARAAKGGRVSLPCTAIRNRSRPRARWERTAPTEIPMLCAASL